MGREKWSSLVWLGMGLFICVGSLRLSLGDFHNPGPGFLSFYAGLILAALALVVHFQSRKAPSADNQNKPVWTSRQKGFKMVSTVFALLAYAVGMNYLGFLVSTFIFLVFLLRVIEPQRWPVALLGSCVASVAFYLIFDFGLQSQLPKGLFRFF